MRTVLTMAVKDLRLISRDWLGLFFIIGFPVLMGIFFGSMYGSVDTESASLNIAVVDDDRSDMSAKFVELARRNRTSSQSKSSAAADAMDRVRRGQLVGMIAIPKGFGETAGILWMEGPAIEVGIDPSRKAEAGMLEGMIMQAVGKLMMARFQDPASMRPLIKQTQDEIADVDRHPDPHARRSVADDEFARRHAAILGRRASRGEADPRRIGRFDRRRRPRTARNFNSPASKRSTSRARFPKAAPRRSCGNCARSGTSAFRSR